MVISICLIKIEQKLRLLQKSSFGFWLMTSYYFLLFKFLYHSDIYINFPTYNLVRWGLGQFIYSIKLTLPFWFPLEKSKTIKKEHYLIIVHNMSIFTKQILVMENKNKVMAWNKLCLNVRRFFGFDTFLNRFPGKVVQRAKDKELVVWYLMKIYHK